MSRTREREHDDVSYATNRCRNLPPIRARACAHQVIHIPAALPPTVILMTFLSLYRTLIQKLIAKHCETITPLLCALLEGERTPSTLHLDDLEYLTAKWMSAVARSTHSNYTDYEVELELMAEVRAYFQIACKVGIAFHSFRRRLSHSFPMTEIHRCGLWTYRVHVCQRHH